MRSRLDADSAPTARIVGTRAGYSVPVIALLIVALAVGASSVGVSTSGASDSATTLTITYWQDENASAAWSARWTLRCNPVGGTLPTRRLACARLSRMTAAAFAPMPRDAVCTLIYGGPQKAVVKGTWRGQPIWSSFRRRDGCEIDRWQRFAPWLIPTGGVSR